MICVGKEVTSKIGIYDIKYFEGDFREPPQYNFIFFRDDELYYEWMNVESAEILLALLGIDKSEVTTEGGK